MDNTDEKNVMEDLKKEIVVHNTDEEINITSYEEFEECINDFKRVASNIHDIFYHVKTNDEHLNDGSTIQGKTAEHTYARVKELQQNYAPIEDALNLYITFLEKTLDDYKLMDRAIDRNAEKFGHALDVNK